MEGHEVVIHLASNPDIARAATEPAVDFDLGTLLTHHVVEAARRVSARRILYASGSGVYGDLGEIEVDEDWGPLVPISTYGASKLAGEALLCSYCFMFGLSGVSFRFGNVVGPRQTHGVGFDFVRKLVDDPTRLEIMGDGSQSKSYIHVDDIVDAVLTAHRAEPGAVRRLQRRDRRLHHGRARSPTWPSETLGLDSDDVRLRVHGRRPRLARRRPGRAPRHRPDPRGSAGATAARRARRSRSRLRELLGELRPGGREAGASSSTATVFSCRQRFADGVPRSIPDGARVRDPCPASARPARRFARPASCSSSSRTSRRSRVGA